MKSLPSVIEDVGNPFLDNSNALLDLETKNVVPETVAQNLYELENVGDKQYQDFIEKIIWKQWVPLSDTIGQNKLSPFKTVDSQSTLKKDEQLSTTKYVLLFSRLFITYQTREGDIESFFPDEIQPNPPSLSGRGESQPAKIWYCGLLTSKRILNAA